ncbi:MAG: hypothetical protein R3F65_30830 [bacterium]
MSRAGATLAAVALLACGAPPQQTLSAAERDALRNRAESAHGGAPRRLAPPPAEDPAPPPEVAASEEAAEMTLPPPPADSLWGDAFGSTQHEAVRNAQRVVSEQISSRLESETRSFEAEYGDGRNDSEASIKIKTTSDFDHAELIKTIGVVRIVNGFTARAALDKGEAARVYAEEIERDTRALEQLGPTLSQAIGSDDASVLLSTRFSPAHIVAERYRKARIMAVLGRPVDVTPAPETLALAKLMTAARAHTTIRLDVGGNASDALRRAVVGEIGRLLGAEGCRFVENAPPVLPERGPVVDATLMIRTRDHQEVGVLWRYLGFELEMIDARNGKPVFSYSAMPEIVHGGGPNWAMADQATARRLGQKLDEKAAGDFKAVTCR